MINRILVCLCLLAGLANAQWRSGGGSTFYWSLTGQAQKTDSLRIIQGTNMTITQSGNTVTFNGAAGAGSTASVRANTGWTSNGTTAQDTLATYYDINGKFQRLRIADTDGDSVIIAPHALYMLAVKDGSTILAVLSDSLGRIYSGNPTGTSIALDPTSANNASIYFREATDNANDFFRQYFEGANNKLIFDGTENDAGSPTITLAENTLIGPSVANAIATLQLTGGSSAANYMIVHNSTTGETTSDGTIFGIDASENGYVWNNETTDLILGTANANRFAILNSGANNWNQLYNTGGSGATLLHFSNTTTGTTIGADGFDIGIGADEVAEITQRENLAMKFFTNNTRRLTIGANGEIGIGGTTDAQNARAKFNVLGRAANDTLAIWSNDGGGLVGDSTVAIDAGGRMGIKTFPSSIYGLTVSGGSAANVAAASYEVGNGGNGTLSNTSSGSSIALLGGGAFGGGIRFNAAASGNRTDRSFWFQTASDTLAAFGLGTANKGYYSFGNGIKPQSQNQAIFTIRPAVPVADTLFMARNDKNSTLDSTMMVFANGDGYFGGNNLYIGGHRIRSNAAGDSLIFYDGNTMIFAILSDGSTADLVAGTPPFKFFGWHRDEIIFWILTIAGFLIWIVAILAIYDKVKEIRIREHKTLPGEI